MGNLHKFLNFEISVGERIILTFYSSVFCVSYICVIRDSLSPPTLCYLLFLFFDLVLKYREKEEEKRGGERYLNNKSNILCFFILH